MDPYPVRFDVDRPAAPLNRLTTLLRPLMIVPIAILMASITGFTADSGGAGDAADTVVVDGVGLLFLPALLMLVFRHKYPAWWFDWNLQLQRFGNRIAVYALLMDDRYPATDADQGVHLELPRPQVENDPNLNRWLPLVKWLLAIPHYVVLALLYVGAFFAVVAAWFAILFTGRYPGSLFGFVEGVLRWHNRVVGYAFVLVTDRYPPFSLRG